MEVGALVARLEAQMETLRADQARQHRELVTAIQRLDEAVRGNGRPGLRIEVDRLKQAEQRRQWLMRAILLAIIGLLVDAFWSRLSS